MEKVRTLDQREWDQLLIVAAGYLPMCDGDLKRAMIRAITGHADLIDAIRRGKIEAELPKGRVRLFVPEEGGLALAYTSNTRPASNRKPAPSYDDLGPSEKGIEAALDDEGR
jgi:hypothetical protein